MFTNGLMKHENGNLKNEFRLLTIEIFCFCEINNTNSAGFFAVNFILGPMSRFIASFDTFIIDDQVCNFLLEDTFFPCLYSRKIFSFNTGGILPLKANIRPTATFLVHIYLQFWSSQFSCFVIETETWLMHRKLTWNKTKTYYTWIKLQYECSKQIIGFAYILVQNLRVGNSRIFVNLVVTEWIETGKGVALLPGEGTRF